MSGHFKACENSKSLCNKLYECLSVKIPNLKRVETKGWCALYQLNRNRFAYIRHRKNISRIEVWCLGDPPGLQNNISLEVVSRKEIKAGWAERFQARFFVDQLSEIESACQLLFQISYILS